MVSYKQVLVSSIQVKDATPPINDSEVERITEHLLICKTAFPPLVVKRLGSRLSCHTYELLTGYQQYYAAQEAKLNRINALILEENDMPEIEAAILSQIQSRSPISEVTEEQKKEPATGPLAFESPASNFSEDSIKTSYPQNQQLLEQNQAIVESLKEMHQQNQRIAEQNQAIVESLKEMRQQNQRLAEQNQAIVESLREMRQQNQRLAEQNQAIVESLKEMRQQNQRLAEQNQAIVESFKERYQQNQGLSEQNQAMCQFLREMQAPLAKINTKIAEFLTSQVRPSTSMETSSSPREDQNQLELKLRLLNEGTKVQIEEWFKKAGFAKRTRESHLKKILNYRSQNHFKSLEELVRCLNIKSSSLEKLKNCPVPPSFPH